MRSFLLSLYSFFTQIYKISGTYSFGVTPVPISNTAVKSKTSMILGWRRPGKVDSARIKLRTSYSYEVFFVVMFSYFSRSVLMVHFFFGFMLFFSQIVA